MEDTDQPTAFVNVGDSQKKSIKKQKKIGKPNAVNIPTPQAIEANRQRTESTQLIDNLTDGNLTKASILEQVYHESNIEDSQAPLLIADPEEGARNLSENASLPKSE